MKVLHITNWYPNAEKPSGSVFVREHIKALAPYAQNEVIHLRFEPGSRFRRIKEDPGGEQRSFHWELPTKRWRLIEWMTGLFLFYLLKFRFRPADHDLINFHVAYPLCTHLPFLKRMIRRPIVITEHWTAYHFHFHLPEETKKLDRIKRIFHHEVPLITVSEALKKDIEEFSGKEQQHAHIVPNAVDTERFYPKEDRKERKGPVFFMLNNWRRIKSPFLLFDSFQEFLKEEPEAILRVGGYGPLWEEMERYVDEKGLSGRIQLLGRLEKVEVADEMQGADAFVHAASYETFSVVCAEALCCGTPVAVTAIPAVSEFVHAENGILVDEKLDWKDAMREIRLKEFDRAAIAEEAHRKFGSKAVGKRYYEVLSQIVEEFHEGPS